MDKQPERRIKKVIEGDGITLAVYERKFSPMEIEALWRLLFGDRTVEEILAETAGGRDVTISLGALGFPRKPRTLSVPPAALMYCNGRNGEGVHGAQRTPPVRCAFAWLGQGTRARAGCDRTEARRG